LSLFVATLDAHKINLFTSQEGDTVEVYSYFANGNPCQSCRLIIKENNNVIVDTTLNKDGKYFFRPKAQELEISVNASGGHKVSESIKIQNIQKENLSEHIKKEKELQYQNIAIGLVIIFLFFILLKAVKR
jgi:hypothetical protein